MDIDYLVPTQYASVKLALDAVYIAEAAVPGSNHTIWIAPGTYAGASHPQVYVTQPINLTIRRLGDTGTVDYRPAPAAGNRAWYIYQAAASVHFIDLTLGVNVGATNVEFANTALAGTLAFTRCTLDFGNTTNLLINGATSLSLDTVILSGAASTAISVNYCQEVTFDDVTAPAGGSVTMSNVGHWRVEKTIHGVASMGGGGLFKVWPGGVP